MHTFRFFMTGLFMCGVIAVSDFGEAASINIVPTGALTYSITATDLQDSAGIELSVLYDKDALESPKVTYGAMTAGTMPAQNVTVPGSIRIVFITTGSIKGTGELASIAFVRKSQPQSWQPKLNPPPSVIAANGSQLAVQSAPVAVLPVTDNKGDDGAVKNSGDSTTGAFASTSSSAASSSVQSGTMSVTNVTLPTFGDQVSTVRDTVPREVTREEPVIKSAESASAVTGSSSSQPEVAAAVDPPAVDKTAGARSYAALKTIQSVLEQFRTFNGPRTVKRLSSLFDPSKLNAAGVVQIPDIVVTDGTTRVTVSVLLANDVDTPSFSLKGANMKSIRQLADNKWELDALPQKDKSDVRLSIILKGERTEISLTAVPPVSKAGTALLALSETALDALLVKPVVNNKPAYDLNSDGKQDYLDDYILVAHWLLKQNLNEKNDEKKPTAVGK